ncbi:DUF2062 domain-containing protein [Poseidonocella sedimentorum]|uniref:DUF2062 domain-containing protein n=1 Tax=Poseidonocella sedimentorum TaxID=871652 RepID=A0A1I6E0P3_9RHOB|nr:DUF2062 domain-containing protein [Poseidonocella sedimentorum]SFR11255.1 hypothetical protein SAMN04515673_106178 [Poseidonocella sedimentorum]
MVFKRRNKRGALRIAAEFLYPRGGWTRAFHYVRHRLTRLPGTPEMIGRGIAVGVFTAFTPFYGLHFFIAALLALIVRGNVLAAILGTFFGNPLTYVPIAVISLKFGHFLLGTHFTDSDRSLFGKFRGAAHDLLANIGAIFDHRAQDWAQLRIFWDEVFWPYLLGGILPGLISALVMYALCVPVIRVYQNRRKGMIKAKWDALRAKKKQADATAGTE